VRLAWLVAIGIGLHNLGEGLAVGTATRAGEVALVVGFAIHNLTEGVAIAAPLASGSRVRWPVLVLLAGVAGLPAVPGLWLGGLTAGGTWAVLGLGVAAGAIAQVVLAVGRLVVGKPGPLAAASFTAAVGLTGLLA
jgi:ZIP family zinc transporter